MSPSPCEPVAMSSSLILSLPLTHGLTSLLPIVYLPCTTVCSPSKWTVLQPYWTVRHVPRELSGPVYPSQVDHQWATPPRPCQPAIWLHRSWAPTEPPPNFYQLPCAPQLNIVDSLRRCQRTRNTNLRPGWASARGYSGPGRIPLRHSNK
jgi:hypothetical protein